MRRALIIETARDQVAMQRQEAVRRSKELFRWEITFVYAIEYEDLPWQREAVPGSILACAASFGDPIPLDSIEERLFFRAKAQVVAFRPELILLYTGFVFRRFPDQMFSALRRLRDEHPELRFGRFGGDTSGAETAPEGVFDRTEDVLAAEEIFYREIQGGRSG
jgi:hypothetical protein